MAAVIQGQVRYQPTVNMVAQEVLQLQLHTLVTGSQVIHILRVTKEATVVTHLDLATFLIMVNLAIFLIMVGRFRVMVPATAQIISLVTRQIMDVRVMYQTIINQVTHLTMVKQNTLASRTVLMVT
ncbi:uncharacterized protein LOC111088546 [Limulus polyphemus]|uniref:Uncharacterized protein LOC111088546 n=1 Tax=Limulus polyphemus TaxID=6850 RepID=A0ABM1TFS3_LIMPO|nr:uncharacterized protein LOC111088546 [Limulus polyphemus]